LIHNAIISCELGKIQARNLGSISPTFNMQFLHVKQKKNTVKLSVFFALLGPLRLKALRKILVKSTPNVGNDFS
jgi:hypothetical protein